ncbi:MULTISPECIES: hypothetical protein [unclassified Mesorhizobium]|uniref:hypothetical protein n=1 Tax=unclassified Mesorhizobium TaxID=325217 RepID=UPI0024174E3A|nr:MULTISPECIES: hypothetical protein [unclassified Mesorhizobium]MDG4902777.1 hypothetical protein [Mesorhizobium sp. WSM4962]MDG4920786.1 hypothetical protein [Mesorhizobium sp. WSM4989]
MIQNILKTIRGQAKSVADLERALAQIDIPRLEADAEKLEDDRRQTLLDGSDKDVEAVERKIEVANREVERAYAAKAELERRIEQARNVEAEQVKVARYEAAKSQADAAAKELRKAYPEIGKRFASLLKVLAEASLAVEEVNRNLPDGATPLQDPEVAVRAKLGEPEKTISEETVDVWCYSNARDIQVLPEDEQVELNAKYRGSNQGVISSGSAGGFTTVTRRRLIRRTCVPRTTNVLPSRLTAVALPGLKVGDPAFWDGPTYTDARTVLATLARLAEARPAAAVNPADVLVEYLDPKAAEQADDLEAEQSSGGETYRQAARNSSHSRVSAGTQQEEAHPAMVAGHIRVDAEPSHPSPRLPEAAEGVSPSHHGFSPSPRNGRWPHGL